MMKTQKGVTLIEVLVTLLVTTVGLLGLAALQLNAMQATVDSSQRSQAVWLMQDLIERMRASPRATNSDYQAAVNCAALPKMCADQRTASGLQSGSDCTPAEIAQFDLWEASCPYNGLAGNQDSVSSSRDSLVASAANNRIVQLATDGDGFTASASWFFKGTGKSSQTESGIGLAQKQEIFR